MALTAWYDELGKFNKSKNQKVLVGSIMLGDVEDPDFIAQQEIAKWINSEAGQCVLAHSAPEPSFHRLIDHLHWGITYNIVAYLEEKDLIYWNLKYR